MNIKVGTRASKLALKQTELAIQALSKIFPERSFEIVPIRVKGDQDKKTPLVQMKQTGIFIKEIELALLDHTIDLAVHSLKDVGSVMRPDLMLLQHALFEDPRDCLVSKDHQTLMELRPEAKLATGSLRRRACIHRLRPDIQFVDLRGNIETRLQKLKESDWDGLILASAGLKRLGLEALIDEYLDPSFVIPACGQGTLALQIRKEDQGQYEKCFSETSRALEVQIERDFLMQSQAGCHVPVGCYAKIHGQTVMVDACFGEDEFSCRFVHDTFSLDHWEQIGSQLLKKLKEQEL